MPNPHYRSGPPSKLYSRARVEEAEQSPEFQHTTKGREKRQAGAKKAVETKRSALIAQMEAIEIRLPSLTPEALVKGAVNHRNAPRAPPQAGGNSLQ